MLFELYTYLTVKDPIIKRENMDLSKKINRINMKKIYRKTNKK